MYILYMPIVLKIFTYSRTWCCCIYITMWPITRILWWAFWNEFTVRLKISFVSRRTFNSLTYAIWITMIWNKTYIFLFLDVILYLKKADNFAALFTLRHEFCLQKTKRNKSSVPFVRIFVCQSLRCGGHVGGGGLHSG